MTLPSKPEQNHVDDDGQACLEKDLQRASDDKQFGPRGERAFLPVEFVMMTLPYQRPADTFWERTNGLSRLTIHAGRFTDANGEIHHFVPYGKMARAALLYLMTQVRRTGSRDIEIGSSFRSFAKAAGIPVSGANAKMVVRQLRALLRCTVSYTKVSTKDDITKVVEGQYVVADKSELWLDVRKEHIGEDGLLTSTVRISENLFASVMSEETRPIDLEKYSKLAAGRSPMAMDIYVWLAARLFPLEKQGPGAGAFIKWEELHSQFGSSNGLREFKRDFKTALEKVLAVDTGMNVFIFTGTTQRKGFKGLVLRRSPGSVTSGPDGKLPDLDPGEQEPWDSGDTPF